MVDKQQTRKVGQHENYWRLKVVKSMDDMASRGMRKWKSKPFIPGQMLVK